MILLTLDEVVVLARRVVPNVQFRDLGLLHGAVARPLATYEGRELYPDEMLKLAALVHSVIRSHALVDGNKRLGLAALIVTLRMNGLRLTMTNDEAYDFIMAIADGTLDDVDAIADRVGTTVEGAD